MRAVVQRCLRAGVTVEGNPVAAVGEGIMALFGFLAEDDEKTMEYMLDKVANLRIFEDENGKMNLSLLDIGGELLIVPNFTLYGDARKGRRPGFSAAASPKEAESKFERLVEKARKLPIKVDSGIFQAHMEVELVNDGPVTILLDSERNF